MVRYVLHVKRNRGPFLDPCYFGMCYWFRIVVLPSTVAYLLGRVVMICRN